MHYSSGFFSLAKVDSSSKLRSFVLILPNKTMRIGLENIVIKHLLICWFCCELTNYWVVFYYLFGIFVLLQIGSTEPILQDRSSLIPVGPILQNELGPISNLASLCQRSVYKYLDTCILTQKLAPTMSRGRCILMNVRESIPNLLSLSNWVTLIQSIAKAIPNLLVQYIAVSINSSFNVPDEANCNFL